MDLLTQIKSKAKESKNYCIARGNRRANDKGCTYC